MSLVNESARSRAIFSSGDATSSAGFLLAATASPPPRSQKFIYRRLSGAEHRSDVLSHQPEAFEHPRLVSDLHLLEVPCVRAEVDERRPITGNQVSSALST